MNSKDVDGNEMYVTPALALMHELVAHAIPAIVGSDSGFGVENENKVRRELGLPEREWDSKHLE